MDAKTIEHYTRYANGAEQLGTDLKQGTKLSDIDVKELLEKAKKPFVKGILKETLERFGYNV